MRRFTVIIMILALLLPIFSGHHVESTGFIDVPVSLQHKTVYASTNGIRDVSWSPNNTQIAIAVAYGLAVYDSGSGILLWYRDSIGGSYVVEWSPDGSKIAVGTTNGVYVFHSNSVLAWKNTSYQHAQTLCWSPDGRYLVVGYELEDSPITVFDSETGQVLWTDKPFNRIAVVAWSPNSKYIAMGYTGGVKIFNSTSGTLISSIPIESTLDIDWTSDSSALGAVTLYGSGNGNAGFYVINSSDWSIYWSDRISDTMGRSVEWSPNDKMIVFTDNLYLSLYHRNGSLIYRLPSYAGSLTYPLYDARWSPDGSLIALANSKYVYTVYSINGSLIWVDEAGSLVETVKWSSDGSRIAGESTYTTGLTIYSRNGSIIYRIPVLTTSTLGLSSIATNYNGSLCILGGARSILMLSVQNSTPVRWYTFPQTFSVRKVVWYPNNEIVLIEAYDNNNRSYLVQAFDNGLSPLWTFNIESMAYDLSWNHNLTKIAVTASAVNLHIIDGETGHEYWNTLRSISYPLVSSWSPSDKFIAVGGYMGLYLLDSSNGSIIWSNDKLSYVYRVEWLDETTIYVNWFDIGNFTNQVSLINAYTGELIWLSPFSSFYYSEINTRKDILFNNRTHLWVYNISTEENLFIKEFPLLRLSRWHPQNQLIMLVYDSQLNIVSKYDGETLWKSYIDNIPNTYTTNPNGTLIYTMSDYIASIYFTNLSAYGVCNPTNYNVTITVTSTNNTLQTTLLQNSCKYFLVPPGTELTTRILAINNVLEEENVTISASTYNTPLSLKVLNLEPIIDSLATPMGGILLIKSDFETRSNYNSILALVPILSGLMIYIANIIKLKK